MQPLPRGLKRQNPQQGNDGEVSGAGGGASSSKQPRKAQARHRLTEDNFYQMYMLLSVCGISLVHADRKVSTIRLELHRALCSLLSRPEAGLASAPPVHKAAQMVAEELGSLIDQQQRTHSQRLAYSDRFGRHMAILMSNEGSSLLRAAADRTRMLTPRLCAPRSGPWPSALQAPGGTAPVGGAAPVGGVAPAAALVALAATPVALQRFSTDDAPAAVTAVLVAKPAAAAEAPRVATAPVAEIHTALALKEVELAVGARGVGGVGGAICAQLQRSTISLAERGANSLARAAAALDAPPTEANSTKETHLHDHPGAATAPTAPGTAAVWQWLPMAVAAPAPPPLAAAAAAADADAAATSSVESAVAATSWDAVAALQALQAGSPHHFLGPLARVGNAATNACGAPPSGKMDLTQLGPLGGAPRQKRAPDAFSQFNLILRRGLAVSTSHHSRSVAELRPMLCSELHSLLARWQQITAVEEWADWQAAAGAAPTPPALAIRISPMAVVATTGADAAETETCGAGGALTEAGAALVPLLLPQPKLFAAMATVRNGLAVAEGEGARRASYTDQFKCHLSVLSSDRGVAALQALRRTCATAGDQPLLTE